MATIKLNEITEDWLNAVEQGQNLTVSGTSEGLTSGQINIVFTDSDGYPDGYHTYYVDFDENGSFSLTIPADDLVDIHDKYLVNMIATSTADTSVSDEENFTADYTSDDITLTLNEDTAGGTGTTEDSITKDATVNIAGLEDTSTWEYSLDGGETWTTGSGTSFELGNNTIYANESVQVKVTDIAGNEQVTKMSAVMTDMTTDDVIVGLENDTGESPSDLITQDGTVKVVGLEDTSTWEYSLDSGETWTTGSDASFELADNTTYTSEAVQVKVVDVAGNESITKMGEITTDTIADAEPNLTASITDTLINNTEKIAVAYTITGLDTDAKATLIFSDGTKTVQVSDVKEDGTVDLSTLSDGEITLTVSATDTAGNTANGIGNTTVLDTTADVNGDFSAGVFVGDSSTNNSEKGDVSVGLSGIDEDAQSVQVTFTDGATTIITDAIKSGSTWSVADTDIATLADGAITLTAKVTDEAGNTKTVTDTFTLDTTADLDGDLQASITSDLINNAGKETVAYEIAGLDSETKATVVFTDSENQTITVEDITAGGTVDLSSLADGEVILTVTAIDTAGNTAVGEGDTVVLDTTADVDSNLQASITSDLINDAGKTTVAYTIAGLDSDAKATLIFSDGTDTVVVSDVIEDGTVDLSTLSDGEITLIVSATDTAGNTATGTGDTAILDTIAIAVDDAASTTEGEVEISGNLLTNDEENATITTFTETKTYGTLVVDETGEYTYTLNASANNKLNEGVEGIDTFDYTITDVAGNTKTATLTVTTTGTNDTPIITSSYTDAIGEVTEDTTSEVTGTLSAQDADTGASLTWSASNPSDTYGTFTITEGGEWKYILDDTKSQTQALKQGDIVKEKFIVTVTDEHGASVDEKVVVTINGTNDAPVIEDVLHTGVDELDGVQTIVTDGQLEATDPDKTETLKLSVTQELPADIASLYTKDNIAKITALLSDVYATLPSDLGSLTDLGASLPALMDMAGVLDTFQTVNPELSSQIFAAFNQENATQLLQSAGVLKDFLTYNYESIVANTDLTVEDLELLESAMSSENITAIKEIGSDALALLADNPTLLSDTKAIIDAIGVDQLGALTSDLLANPATLTTLLNTNVQAALADTNVQSALGSANVMTALQNAHVVAVLNDSIALAAFGNELVMALLDDNSQDNYLAVQADTEAKAIYDALTGSQDSQDNLTVLKNDSDAVVAITALRSNTTDMAIINTLLASNDSMIVINSLLADTDALAGIQNLPDSIMTFAVSNPTTTSDIIALLTPALMASLGDMQTDITTFLANNQTLFTDLATLADETNLTQLLTDAISLFDGTKDGNSFTLSLDVSEDLIEKYLANGKLTKEGDIYTANDANIVIEDLTPKITFELDGDVGITDNPNNVAILDLKIVDFKDDGSYKLEGNFDALAEGETVTVAFKYKATDSDGGVSAPKSVSIVVTGTNDKPEIQAYTDIDVVSEADTMIGSISLTDVQLSDADINDSHEFVTFENQAVTVVSSAQSNGANIVTDATISMDKDGNYTLIGSTIDNLAEGEMAQVTFAVQVKDSSQTDTDISAEKLVTLNIIGTNDAPEIQSTVSEQTIIEGNSVADLVVSDTVTFTDVDTTDTHTVKSVFKSGTYTYSDGSTATQTALGSITQSVLNDTTGNNTGEITWKYIVNDSDVQHLADGEKIELVYAIKVVDTPEKSDIKEVKVTITGTNDAPVLSSENITGEVTEANTTDNLTDNGTIAFADVDLTDTHTISVSNASVGALGGLTASVTEDANADNGTVDWIYTVSDTDVQYLAAGETKVETFDITINDGHGGTDTKTVSVTITGTNDVPSIDESDTVGLTEIDTALTATGTMLVSDVDTTNEVITTVVGVEVSGTNYTDASLTGVDLKALLTLSNNVISATENAKELTWSFDSGANTFDYLAAGETLILTYKLEATDYDGDSYTDTETVTVTITGTNDQPVVQAVDANQSVDFEGTIDPVGHITTNSLVNGSSDTWTFTHDGGDLTIDMLSEMDEMQMNDGVSSYIDINSDGNQSAIDLQITLYDESGMMVTNAWEDMDLSGNDDSVSTTDPYLTTENLVAGTYTVVVSGSSWNPETPSPYRMNIVGNSVQILGGQSSGQPIYEADGVQNIFNGNLPAVSDVDTNDTYVYNLVGNSTTVTSPYIDDIKMTDIEVTVDAVGAYFLKGNFDALAQGETATVTFQYTADDQKGFNGTDGTNENSVSEPQTVTMTITGTNDQPIIKADIVDAYMEDAIVVSDVTGNLLDDAHIEDLDINDTHRVQSFNGQWEQWYQDPNNPDPANGFNAIKTTVTLAYTVNGNDYTSEVPVIVNIDTGEYTISQTDLNKIPKDIEATTTVAYEIQDNHGGYATGNLTIKVTGQNDLAIITGDSTEHTHEDLANVLSGQILVSDLDIDEAKFVALTDTQKQGTYGTFSIDESGNWTYTLDNTLDAVQALGEGDASHDVLTVSTVDGTTRDIDVTIVGTNDVPTLSVSRTLDYTENDGVKAMDNTVNLSDIDSVNLKGAIIKISENYTATEDSLTFEDTANIKGSFNSATGELTLSGVASINEYESALESISYSNSSEQPNTEERTIAWQVVDDYDGLSGVQTTKITVTAVNDIPNASDKTIMIDEDNSHVLSVADFGFSDVDGELKKVQIITLETQGALKLDGVDVTQGEEISVEDIVAGKLLFTPATDANGIGYDSFTFRVSDGTVYSDEKTIMYDVNPVDDATLTVAEVNSTNEDTTLTVDAVNGVLKNDTDIDNELAVTTFTVDGVTTDVGTTLTMDGVGTFVMQESGAYVFTPTANFNGKVPQIQYTLNTGVSDTLNLTVSAVADQAIIGGDTVGTVIEDVNQHIHGVMSVSDVDAGEAEFVVQTDTAKANGYGTFSIDTAGTWTYALDNDNATVQALGVNSTPLTEEFEVESKDGTIEKVTVTIKGTNDKAVITATDGTIAEGTATVSGDANSTDIDGTDDKFIATTTDTTYGTYSVTEAGVWTYALTSDAGTAVDKLGAGDTLTDTITLTTEDGTTKDVTIIITGTNDEPTITGTVSGEVTEDSDAQVGGELSITDVDEGEAEFIADIATGTYGAFAVSEDGTWTYNLDNTLATVQALGATSTVEDTFAATSKDGTKTQELKVTINGTNDKAVIAGVLAGTIAEDIESLEGVATSSDVDGDNTFVAVTDATATFGTYSVADGKWTYKLLNTNTDVQALGVGDALTDTITLTATDGTTKDVTITITGTNDAPKLASIDAVELNEDDTLVTGTITASDVDTSDSLLYFTDANIAGFTLDSTTGAWSFDPSDEVYQHLKAGVEEVITIPVTVTDENGLTDTENLVIKVTGTNDIPVAVADVANANEEQTIMIDVLANDTDIDDGAELVIKAGSLSVTGNGIATIVDGKVQYVASGYDALKEGETATVRISYTVTDGTGEDSSKTATVTVTGTNDVPTLQINGTDVTTDDSLTVNEDETGSVTFTTSDIDAGDVVTTAVEAEHGSVVVEGSNITYTADENYHGSDVITVTATDAHGAVVTKDVAVTVTSVNDAPVITSISSVDVHEGQAVVNGTVVASDVDGDNLIFTTTATVAGFTLNANGTYSFDATDAAYNSMDEGDVQAITIPVNVNDGTADISQNLVITVTGTNDAPVAVADGAGMVTGTSIDDTSIIAARGTVGSVQYTKFSVLEDGTTVTLDASTAEIHDPYIYLLRDDGAMTSDDIISHNDDGGSGYAARLSQTLNVGDYIVAIGAYNLSASDVIDGINDGGTSGGGIAHLHFATDKDITVYNASAYNTDEDTTTTIDVLANDTDVDGDDTPTNFSLDSVSSDKGSVSIVENKLQFNPSEDFNHLAVGESETIVISYSMSDDSGATSTSTATIRVTGTNDAPVIATIEEVYAHEGDSPVLTGTVVATDVDDGAVVTYATTSAVAGFMLNENGTWTFDATHADYEAMDAGDLEELSIVIKATDDKGATDTQTLKINLSGTNDVPVAVVDTVVNVDENASVTLDVLANDTDVDGDDTVETFSLDSAEATEGEVSIVDNKIVFEAGEAFDHLDEGVEETVTITYAMSDDSGATSTSTATLKVIGKEDGAVIVGDSTAHTHEDVDATLSGKVTVIDADDGEAEVIAQTAVVGIYGTFNINADGNWTYALDNTKTQALNEGDEVTDTLTVTSKDASATQDITITIVGTNDAPTAIVDTGATVNENTTVTIGVLDNDTDKDAAHTFTLDSVTAPKGSVSIVDNQLVFEAGSDFDHLLDAETETVVVTYSMSDEHGATSTNTATIAVSGVNDQATITGTNIGVVNESYIPMVMGKLTVSDADDNQAGIKALDADALKGTYGTFEVQSDGTWTYTLDPENADKLAEGQAVTETLEVESKDASATKTITVTVTGTNDLPTLTVESQSGEVTEDVDTTSTSGTVSFGDVDDIDTHTMRVESVSADALGALEVKTEGSITTWNYSVDNALIQYLKEGETKVEAFDITVDDGHGGVDTKTVAITITGANDIADIAGDAEGKVVEDKDTQINGVLTISDADADESAFMTQVNSTGMYGKFSLDSAGTWTYDLDSTNTMVQALAKDATLSETFEVVSKDGDTKQDVTVTIKGTNDIPTITGDATASLVEDGAIQVDGKLDISDVDTTENSFQSGNIAGEYGTFSVDADGKWVYDVTADIQPLKEGEVVTETFTVKSYDSTATQDVVVSITGTNDAPVLADISDLTIDEDTKGSFTFVATDVDQDDPTLVTTAEATHGEVNVLGDKVTYTPDANFNGIDTIALITTDEKGSTVTKSVTVTVFSVNDIPVINMIGEVYAHEGDAPALTGIVTSSDKDGDTITYAIDGDTPKGFVLNSDGTWTFDASDSSYESMNEGDLKELSVVIKADDGQGGSDTQTLKINLSGINDVPTLSVIAPAEIKEDEEAVLTFNTNDLDSDATLITTAEAEHGSVMVDGSNITYKSDKDYSGSDVITVSTVDEKGAVVTKDVNITVLKTNDAPVIQSIEEVYANEGDTPALTGVISASDIDGDTITYSAENVPAGFTIDSTTGAWSFDPKDDTYDGMKEGELKELSVVIKADDGEGGSDTQTLKINLSGTNDAPVVLASAIETIEDAAVVRGSVVATDVDQDDETLSYSTDAQVAGFELTADGSYTFDSSDEAYQHLAEGATESMTIPVTVTDEKGATDTKNLFITITGTNDAPVSTADVANALEEQTIMIDVLTNDTDVDDGATLTISEITSVVGGGEATIKEGKIEYVASGFTLADGVSEDVTITYTMSDGIESVTQTAVVTVTGNNILPMVKVSDTTTLEDTAVEIPFTAQDSDGSIVNTVVEAEHGTVVLKDGKMTYTPDVNFFGTDTVSVIVTDDDGATVSKDIKVTVESVNDAPVVTSITPLELHEGQALVFGFIRATDADGDNLTFTTDKEVAGFTLKGDGSYSFDASIAAYDMLKEGEVETIMIPVAVSDGEKSVLRELSITITGTNDIPTLTLLSDSLTLDEDASGDVVFTTSDIDGSVTTAVEAEHGSVSIEDEKVHYEADANYVGTDTITVTSTDDSGAVVSKDISVEMKPMNDAPIIETIEEAYMHEDDAPALTGQIKASDIDSETVSFSVEGVIPEGFALSEDGSWTFDASSYDSLNENELKEIVIMIVAKDDENGVDKQALKINLTGTNDAPIAVADTAKVDEGKSVTIKVLENDTDVDSRDNKDNFSLDSAFSDKGTVAIVAGQLVFTAGADFAHLKKGEYEDVLINYTMSDDSDAESSATVTVRVEGTKEINNAPEAVADSVVTDEDNAIIIDVLSNDKDLDADTLTVSTLSNATHGTVKVESDNRVTYTPNSNYNGDDTFTYTVSDGEKTDTATVDITINPVNDAPVAVDDKLALKDFLTTNMYDGLLANDTDVDGDKLEITAANLNTYTNQGELSLSMDDESGFLNFTPSTSFSEVKEFTYTISDGHGGTSTATVTIEEDDGLSIIHGSDASDYTIYGTSKNDIIYAHNGDDKVKAADGDDIIYGGDGIDNIEGECGDDIIIGGKGNDYLKGGWGDDRYTFRKGDGEDIVADGFKDRQDDVDVIAFDKDVKKEDISMFVKGNSLIIQYSDGDIITVADEFKENQFNIEKVELSDGSYLDQHDIEQLIQSISAYGDSKGIALDSVNDVRKNVEMMTMVSSAWHH